MFRPGVLWLKKLTRYCSIRIGGIARARHRAVSGRSAAADGGPRELAGACSTPWRAKSAFWQLSRSSIRASRIRPTSTCTASAPWPSFTRRSRCRTATWSFSSRDSSAFAWYRVAALKPFLRAHVEPVAEPDRSARHGTVRARNATPGNCSATLWPVRRNSPTICRPLR